MKRIQNAVSVLIALGALLVAVTTVGAQELPGSGMGAQSLRPYWHVFIAYAIAIVLVLGWVVSIGRRLKDVEERLGQ